MNNIRFVVWLCVCILIATGGAFGASVVPPNAVDIVDVVYDPNPVPGTIQEMMITLNINTPCTIALTTKCFGELELVNSFDGIKVFGANTGQPVTKSIPISFMGGTESSRVALSVHASGYNGVFGADTQTMITIVPEMGAATTGYDVGVFFDQAGTVSCLPDSTSFPCMVTAYLLLARYGETSGVVGWEGELSCDAGLYPIQGSLAGTGLNLASFPAYIVGLSEPLGPDSTILLATFLVYATNPGGIYFRGLGVNGIDAYPAFVAEGGERTPLGYIYGGTDSPVASVGEPVCPGLSDMARYRSSVFPAYGSKSAPMREPQVQVIERGPRVDGKSATLTYTVSVSGDITFGNSFSADRQGVYGSRVSLMFRNRSNGNGWHPSINSAEHVTYDLLDEGGHYDFGFSFSASQSWVESYDQIRILVSPVNSGCKIPADDTGYRVWDFDVAGYVDYLNEVDGVEIEFDASVATISYVADNTVFNWALGGTLRNMKLSHELVSALYEGAVPYSLPPVAARVEDLGSGWGGVYQSCGSENAITIDPDWSVSWIVDHEYGHYLNHRAWGGNCSGQWTDHTADNFIEGFGIFFSFAARSSRHRASTSTGTAAWWRRTQDCAKR